MNDHDNQSLPSDDSGQPENPSSPETDAVTAFNFQKIGVLLLVLVAFGIGFYLVRTYLSIDFLAEQEVQLRSYFESNPAIVYLAAFLIYTVVAALSIPGGALFLSLSYAWFFGFFPTLILVSFASTLGATIAFLISRYLLHDWIESRFGKRMETIHKRFEEEGVFYLFLMRLIPAFPFYLVNLIMGLTRIKTATFWWVSQIGMLAGTAVFVYAGSRIPDLQTLKEEGIDAVFSPQQLFQFTIAFALIGLFPIVAKKLVALYQNKSSE